MNPNFNFKSFLRRPPVLAAAACRAVGSLSGGGSYPTKQEIGTVSSVVVGGIADASLGGGSAFGTATGAAAGGYVGNRIGRDLEHKHKH